MHDDELDAFKRDIHLVEYAIGRHGYRRLPRESSRSSHVLHRPEDNDKILVTREADGHWVYCSVRDSRDNGTIIDFVTRRDKLSLGAARKELRDWLHMPHPDLGPSSRPETPPVVRDRAAVAAAFAAAEARPNSLYLNRRGIRPETLASTRFADTWKVDRRGNVLFAHRDVDGLCGFEIKNTRFTGFATGGSKALWLSDAGRADTRLVVAESAIDALSYHQLHPELGVRYASTAGSLSPEQESLISRTLTSLSQRTTTLVAAVDADAGGDQIAATLERVAKMTGVPFERHSPTICKDWNDFLQRMEQDFIRSLPRDRTRGPEHGR